MTIEEIIENNLIIAEFMGTKIGVDLYSWHPGSTVPIQKEHLNYHASWGWLMAVVDKIEGFPEDDFRGKFIVYISSNTCTIQGSKLNTTKENYHPAYFADYSLETKIESVWYACVCFIKWYVNKNQNEEKNH